MSRRGSLSLQANTFDISFEDYINSKSDGDADKGASGGGGGGRSQEQQRQAQVDAVRNAGGRSRSVSEPPQPLPSSTAARQSHQPRRYLSTFDETYESFIDRDFQPSSRTTSTEDCRNNNDGGYISMCGTGIGDRRLGNKQDQNARKTQTPSKPEADYIHFLQRSSERPNTRPESIHTYETLPDLPRRSRSQLPPVPHAHGASSYSRVHVDEEGYTIAVDYKQQVKL